MLPESDICEKEKSGSISTSARVMPSRQQPVILVHGITNTAATFEGQRQHLLKSGWSNAEVYGTTYGDGGKTPAPLVDMKFGGLFKAVAEFTMRRVDVIAYSMGSPVARKVC
ncbi:hypothetical protein COOONC_25442 [Cooperia oncophora]